MSRIDISVVDAKSEQRELLQWAARVDAGKTAADAVSQLSFATYSQLHAALSEKRMELLEFIAQHEGLNIRQIAAKIGRDYKNVYADTQLLLQLGLVAKRGKGFVAPYDEINIHKTLRRVA